MDSVWWRMWVDPQPTLERVIKKNSRRDFYLLASLYGLPIVLHAQQAMSLGKGMTVGLLLLFACLFAAPVGLIAIYAVSWILLQVGKLLKGKASYREIRMAVAWSNLPMVVIVFAWLIESCIFGGRVFKASFFDQGFSVLQQASLLTLSLLQFAANLWIFFLLLKSMALIQRFSMQKAVINVVAPYLVFVAWMALVQ